MTVKHTRKSKVCRFPILVCTVLEFSTAMTIHSVWFNSVHTSFACLTRNYHPRTPFFEHLRDHQGRLRQTTSSIERALAFLVASLVPFTRPLLHSTCGSQTTKSNGVKDINGFLTSKILCGTRLAIVFELKHC